MLRAAWRMRCSFSTSAIRTYPSPCSPKPTPGETATSAFSTRSVENSTLPIDEGICLTATLDILKAIARGDGPQRAVLALGYAGWAPGQLENEINQNGWLHCAADSELIFSPDTDAKYEKAFRKIGIDLGMLSSEAGHA